ncbi:MAG: hypothetical protein O2856_05760 [Planctomycetota bacterium]|nr:hypothetical protein [Planctomycetota bacterium]
MVEVAADAKETTAPVALIFELENIAVGGRECQYKALEKALSSSKVSLNPILYSRFCVDRSIKAALTGLFGHNGDNSAVSDKIIEAAQAELATRLAAVVETKNTELDGVLAKLKQKGVAIGAVSALSKNLVDPLSAALDCGGRGITVQTSPNANGRYPSMDTWRSAARALKVKSIRCVAICTSAASCRNAIAANMACIAIPDKYTNFQDFGGTNAVLESLEISVINRSIAAMDA